MGKPLVKIVAGFAGLVALGLVGYLMHKYGLGNPKRDRFRDGINASSQLRTGLGLDCNLTVDVVPDTDEQVLVTVVYPKPPTDPGLIRDLMRNTNQIVRRNVHNVRDVKVVLGVEREVLPSWDGGVAVAGAPVPVGVKPPAPDAPPKNDAPAPAPAPAKKPAKPNGPSGTVTLVTFPNATVLEGKNSLGTTPLFNLELSTGTHLLTLIGDDGLKHRLSLPVKQGKNAPLKLELADLPAK
jgi:hypothetical protein